jgi:hypothetical protein
VTGRSLPNWCAALQGGASEGKRAARQIATLVLGKEIVED